ncbi:MAG: hypothetical protein L0Y66_19305, partial [Myxococcaceae bacterium]|nr:hypothetical protein [Myxococcaceae bacterium]MCI0669040.1 hypothetical protein [Myxococcaceae bacterium]
QWATDPAAQQQWATDPAAQQQWATDPAAQQQWATDPAAQQAYGVDPSAHQAWSTDASAQQAYGVDPSAQPAWSTDALAQQAYGVDPGARPAWSTDPSAQHLWATDRAPDDGTIVHPAPQQSWTGDANALQGDATGSELQNSWASLGQEPDPYALHGSDVPSAPAQEFGEVPAAEALTDAPSESLDLGGEVDLPSLHETPPWMKTDGPSATAITGEQFALTAPEPAWAMTDVVPHSFEQPVPRDAHAFAAPTDAVAAPEVELTADDVVLVDESAVTADAGALVSPATLDDPSPEIALPDSAVLPQTGAVDGEIEVAEDPRLLALYAQPTAEASGPEFTRAQAWLVTEASTDATPAWVAAAAPGDSMFGEAPTAGWNADASAEAVELSADDFVAEDTAAAEVPAPASSEVEVEADLTLSSLPALTAPRAETTPALALERVSFGDVEADVLEVSMEDVAEAAARPSTSALEELSLDGAADDAVPLAATSDFIEARGDDGRATDVSLDTPAEEFTIESGPMADLAQQAHWSPQVTPPAPSGPAAELPEIELVEAMETTGPEHPEPAEASFDVTSVADDLGFDIEVREARASFIAGEQRVILHTVEGQVKRGMLRDVDLESSVIPLEQQLGFAPERISSQRVKAIFFMLAAGERQPAAAGQKIRVTFHDGRQLAGFSTDHRQPAPGFFVVPADNRTNTARIYVFRSAVQAVAEG